MSDNKIRAEYTTGHTGTFSVYNGSTDALRGSAGQTMTEAATGYYVGTPSPAMVALDWVVVLFDGVAVYQGQFQPEVQAPDVSSVLATVNTNVGTLITNGGKVNNVSVQQEVPIEQTKARVYL